MLVGWRTLPIISNTIKITILWVCFRSRYCRFVFLYSLLLCLYIVISARQINQLCISIIFIFGSSPAENLETDHILFTGEINSYCSSDGYQAQYKAVKKLWLVALLLCHHAIKSVMLSLHSIIFGKTFLVAVIYSPNKALFLQTKALGNWLLSIYIFQISHAKVMKSATYHHNVPWAHQPIQIRDNCHHFFSNISNMRPYSHSRVNYGSTVFLFFPVIGNNAFLGSSQLLMPSPDVHYEYHSWSK